MECDVSRILGFQIIAQINDINRVNVLYVNTSMDPRSPATVYVPSDGEYMVTVLPNRAGKGILDAAVELSQLVMVDNSMTTDNGMTTSGDT